MGLSRKLSRLMKQHPKEPFKPIKSDKAWNIRITAGAGTELAEDYSAGNLPKGTRARNCSQTKEVYNP